MADRNYNLPYIQEQLTSVSSSPSKEQDPLSNVDRLEVIDETGRAYVKGSIYGSPVEVELSYQDDGRTLKVFVKNRT